MHKLPKLGESRVKTNILPKYFAFFLQVTKKPLTLQLQSGQYGCGVLLRYKDIKKALNGCSRSGRGKGQSPRTFTQNGAKVGHFHDTTKFGAWKYPKNPKNIRLTLYQAPFDMFT